MLMDQALRTGIGLLLTVRAWTCSLGERKMAKLGIYQSW